MWYLRRYQKGKFLEQISNLGDGFLDLDNFIVPILQVA